jgi:hypothetical protein
VDAGEVGELLLAEWLPGVIGELFSSAADSASEERGEVLLVARQPFHGFSGTESTV